MIWTRKVARIVLASAAYTTAIVAGLLLLLACDGMYRVVVPCAPDSARGTRGDTIIPCSAFRPDSLP